MTSINTQTTKGNILVVDDTPDNLRLLSTMLAEQGYKVRKSISGQMALISAKAVLPDLILLDINMPGMNGYEVCTQLKADEQTRDVPVIFISALDEVLDKIKAFAVGGVDYITKPFQAEEVIARIENQLTLVHQRSSLRERTAQLEQEIKERRRAEEALRESATKLRNQNLVLIQLAKSSALHQGDLQAALKDITEVSAQNMGVERSSVWLLDETGTKLQCLDLFEKSCNQHSEGIELAAVDYPAYFQALQQDEPIAADKAHTDARTRDFSASYWTPLGITSTLDAPIRIKGQTAGVLCLEQIGDARHWTPEDQSFARSLADLVSLAVEARDRKQAELALAVSQRTLSTLMSNLPGIAYRCLNDPDWRMLFISEGCYGLTGYPADAFTTLHTITYDELIHPEDRQRVRDEVRAALNHHRSFQMTYRIHTATGTLKWVWEQGQGIFNSDGELLYLEGLITDVTARIQAEEALRQGEERWQLVLRGTGDGIFDWNITTGETFASARLLEMLGYAERELTYSHHTWRSLVHPDDLDRALGAVQAHLERKTPLYRVEYRLRCKDGSYKWVLARGQAQWDESGQPVRMVGSHQDISDRKRVEEEVQLLLTISQAISAAPDFDTAIEVALQQVCETTSWAYGEAWVPTPDTSALVCNSRWYCQRTTIDQATVEEIERFREYSEVLTFLPSEEIPGQVLSTRQSQWLHDLSEMEDVLLRLELATACGLKAAFGVPIVAIGNRNEQTDAREVRRDSVLQSSYLLSSQSPVLAVLVFFTLSIRPEDQRWSELVNAVAAQSGMVLHQKKVQAEMRALFAAMTDVVTVRDASGRCLNVIPTNTSNLYQPPDVMIGRKLHDDLPREQADWIVENILRAVSTQTTISIEYCLPIGGKEVWLAETISPLSVETAILVARDISDRKLTEEALRLEQEKSEQLLLNVLPEPIANQLKDNSGALAKRSVALAEQFNEVTIMFADIVGFTPLSTRLTPIELVNLLNQIFSTFDELAEQLGLEKIKTIGDAYMVAAGLPIPRPDHAEAIAQMALAMQAAIERFQSEVGENIQIRIGINTGIVVAGVIGTRKFIYDLWGDAVNVASRMESTGQPGSIQVTAATYERIKDKYAFQKRGAIPVKGKGEMVTYWLIGAQTDTSFGTYLNQ
jgi:PAS domain S-box-containing protein